MGLLDAREKEVVSQGYISEMRDSLKTDDACDDVRKNLIQKANAAFRGRPFTPAPKAATESLQERTKNRLEIKKKRAELLQRFQNHKRERKLDFDAALNMNRYYEDYDRKLKALWNGLWGTLLLTTLGEEEIGYPTYLQTDAIVKRETNTKECTRNVSDLPQAPPKKWNYENPEARQNKIQNMTILRAIIYRWCEQVAIHMDLNANLRDITSDSNKSTIKSGTPEAWFNYAACLLHCLEELKSSKYGMLYRGYSCDFMEIFNGSYHGDPVTGPEDTVGKHILLSGFTSTSTDHRCVKQDAFTHGDRTTVFNIKNATGYEIDHLAIDENEAELLCPPGLVLEITDVIVAPGRTYVHLTVVTPGITLKR